MTTLTAQMATSLTTGRWRLYVAVLGVPASRWPEYDFGRAAPVPTAQERSRALDALGYVFTGTDGWRWCEDVVPEDDPASPVRLIASIRVREAV